MRRRRRRDRPFLWCATRRPGLPPACAGDGPSRSPQRDGDLAADGGRGADGTRHEQAADTTDPAHHLPRGTGLRAIPRVRRRPPQPRDSRHRASAGRPHHDAALRDARPTEPVWRVHAQLASRPALPRPGPVHTDPARPRLVGAHEQARVSDVPAPVPPPRSVGRRPADGVGRPTSTLGRERAGIRAVAANLAAWPTRQRLLPIAGT
jgi:hypothetical protein